MSCVSVQVVTMFKIFPASIRTSLVSLLYWLEGSIGSRLSGFALLPTSLYGDFPMSPSLGGGWGRELNQSSVSGREKVKSNSMSLLGTCSPYCVHRPRSPGASRCLPAGPCGSCAGSAGTSNSSVLRWQRRSLGTPPPAQRWTRSAP